LVSHCAPRAGCLGRPDGLRKLPPTPGPRIAGLSVYASFALAFGVLDLVLPQALSDGFGVNNRYLHLFIACGAVALIGLVDDIVGVSPWAKVLVQFLAAIYLYYYGFQIRALTNPFGDVILLGYFA